MNDQLRWVRGDSRPLDTVYGPRQIKEAAERLRPFIHRTPVMTSRWLDRTRECQFFFKCENLQKGGAFKIRGAANAVLSLSPEAARRGVVTHSSGNHAQALAIAAAARQIPCTVVMPSNAPEVKRRATEGYGATVRLCEPTQEARVAMTCEIQEETGATLVHPFDQSEIILGQATCANELLEDHPDLDWVAAPIGGGGLMAGTCLASNYFSQARLLAAEPEGADDAFRGSQTGERVLTQTPCTIADGLLTTVGEKNWDIVYRLVNVFHTVTDEQIIAAMQFFWERMKLVVEPSGAVSLAAVLAAIDAGLLAKGQKIGIIISGGNRPFSS